MLVFQGGTLIDGTGGPVQRDTTVLVEGPRIRWIGPSKEAELPAQARVLDVTGKTIIPGMIDVHAHLCNETSFNPHGSVGDLIPFTAIRGVVAARAMLDSGFTTCRDLGALGYANVALKQAIDRGLVPGPRLLTCGEMVLGVGTAEDGYFRPEIKFPRTGVFSGPDEARRAVRTQVYHGADVIELIASGLVSSNAPNTPWDQEITREEMAAVVEEAHRFGKRVAAHAYTGQTVSDCVMAGVDGIEHGALIDEPTMALMAERGTFLTPTMMPFSKLFLPNAEELYEPFRVERGRRVAGPQQDKFPKYMEYGLKIAVGSDGPNAGSPPGTSALELELLVKAGMAPMQAIQSATRVGAEVLGLADDLGTIEAGKLADLVVVDGDPLADIRVLQDRERIVAVVKEGEVVRSTL